MAEPLHHLTSSNKTMAYYTETLQYSQHNYFDTQKELLAVVFVAKHSRPYLYWHRFQLRTDHASLIWLWKRSEPSVQVARWLETLVEFSYSIEHRKGMHRGWHELPSY